MKIELRQKSDSASEATIGAHRVLIDRPSSKGGIDAGPMGGELFLASVGGCFMSTCWRRSRHGTRKSPASGRRSPRHSTDRLPVSWPWNLPSLLTAPVRPLEKLVEIAERGCIMTNTLRGKLELNVRIGAPV